MAKISEVEIPALLFDEQGSAPTTPGSTLWKLYFKSDGLYIVDDAGSETGPLSTGGGGGGTGWSPILETKGSTDDPPDDEFDDTTGMSGATNGLDVKWTAAAGTSGTVSHLETGNVAKYDLATRDGWLLMQAGNGGSQSVELRQDYTLGDGASIVAAISPSMLADAAHSNNEWWVGLGVNDTDTSFDAGNYAAVFFDVNGGSGDTNRIIFYSGSAVQGTFQWDGGQIIYMRIDRSGSTYYGFISYDGSAWVGLGAITPGATATNVWLFADNRASVTGEPVPVHAVKWVRLGGSGVDPW